MKKEKCTPEQRKFLLNRIGNIPSNKYTIEREAHKPAKIVAAEKLVDEWEKAIDKKRFEFEKSASNLKNKAYELVHGNVNYDTALAFVLKTENEIAKLKAGVV